MYYLFLQISRFSFLALVVNQMHKWILHGMRMHLVMNYVCQLILKLNPIILNSKRH